MNLHFLRPPWHARSARRGLIRQELHRTVVVVAIGRVKEGGSAIKNKTFAPRAPKATPRQSGWALNGYGKPFLNPYS